MARDEAVVTVAMTKSTMVQARGNGLRWVAVVALALTSTGCPPPPPAEVPEPCDAQIVTLNIYAGDDINPNETDNPRPVVVRLYQLTTDMTMANARYDDILLKDEEVLGKQIMGRNEITLFPNDRVQVKFERNPDAYYLAATAMFHGPQGNSWKTFYQFPPMPDTPAACNAEDASEEEPQAFPETSFFVVERKIDNGGQFDATMFPNSRPFKKLNLPKGSAGG